MKWPRDRLLQARGRTWTWPSSSYLCSSWEALSLELPSEATMISDPGTGGIQIILLKRKGKNKSNSIQRSPFEINLEETETYWTVDSRGLHLPPCEDSPESCGTVVNCLWGRDLLLPPLHCPYFSTASIFSLLGRQGQSSIISSGPTLLCFPSLNKSCKEFGFDSVSLSAINRMMHFKLFWTRFQIANYQSGDKLWLLQSLRLILELYRHKPSKDHVAIEVYLFWKRLEFLVISVMKTEKEIVQYASSLTTENSFLHPLEV